MPRYVGLTLLLIAALMRPAWADMRHYTAEYRIYLSGILLSIVDLQLSLSDTAYRLSAHIGPAGVGHILSDSHVITTTRGALVKGDFRPERIDLSWSSDSGVKSTYMDYENGAPLRFYSGYDLPPEAQPKIKVDITKIGSGSVDPFLAMLAPIKTAPLAQACIGKIRVFDGRRLATLTADNPQPIAVAAHDYESRIPLVKCAVEWQPIAGYSERSMARADDLPPIEAFYGRVAMTGFAAPLEMQAETRYGAISIYAKRFFEPVGRLPEPFDMADFLDDEDNEDDE